LILRRATRVARTDGSIQRPRPQLDTESYEREAGPALYNRLGLTTQIPKTVAIAVNRATHTKDLGTIRTQLLSRRAPISDSTVPLLEILDTLRDARKVPDANVERVIWEMTKRLTALTPAAQVVAQPHHAFRLGHRSGRMA